MDPRKFFPHHLGGYERNIYNLYVRWITMRRNRKPLWDFVKENQPRRILEIGLGDGLNSKKMINLSENCKYYCFDNLSSRVGKEAYEDMVDMDNTYFFIGDTKKTLPKFVESLPKMDLIFIDGSHDYEIVKNDWEHCRKLMHRETVCFFHDYNSAGVGRVIDEIEGYSKEIIKPPKSPPDFALIMKKRGEGDSNNNSNRWINH